MQRTCHNSWCSAVFEITDDDLAFYEKVSPVFGGKKELIPPPTLCPPCRSERRLAWRNGRTLYNRTCSATGKRILSVHHARAPFPVLSNDVFWSDKWDPLSSGMEIDLQKSFFLQFEELAKRTPHISLQNAVNENSDYTSYAGWNKNCYWIFYSDYNRDCCYLEDSFHNLDCLDCSYTHRSTLCYESFCCTNCYNCRYAQGCCDCNNSWFLKNCIGCKNCFGCINLRKREYCFFNEQLSKMEYETKIALYDLQRHDSLQQLRGVCAKHFLSFPHKSVEGMNNDHVTGDYINNCKSIRSGYIIEHSQDCAYIYDCQKCTDCMDMDGWGGSGAQLVYEGQTIGDSSQNIAFSNNAWTGASNVYYSDFCANNCHDLFGCVSLQKKQYCILNRQYSKREYESLIPKIIEKMRSDGEWGEFFPVAMSPFGYNETVAQQIYPLTKAEAFARGFRWKEEENREFEGTATDFSALPSHIQDIDDSICDAVLRCEFSGKPFRIQKMELNFYRKTGLPVPHFHPDTRYYRRMLQRNPRTLCTRTCMKCGKAMITTYAPDRPEIVYCEECYLAEI